MTVELRHAAVHAVDFAERTIEVLAVPYDEPTRGPVDGTGQRELIEPGAFDGMFTGEHHVTVNREHDPTLTIGKVVGYRRHPRGLAAVIKVSNTPLGDETLALASDGVLKASVGMVVRVRDRARSGLRRVKRAVLDHLALVTSPAYASASVLAVRRQPVLGPDEPEPCFPDPFGQLRL